LGTIHGRIDEDFIHPGDEQVVRDLIGAMTANAMSYQAESCPAAGLNGSNSRRRRAACRTAFPRPYRIF